MNDLSLILAADLFLFTALGASVKFILEKLKELDKNVNSHGITLEVLKTDVAHLKANVDCIGEFALKNKERKA